MKKLRGRGSGEAWGQNPVWLCQQLPLDPGEGPWTSGNPDRVHRSSRAHHQRQECPLLPPSTRGPVSARTPPLTGSSLSS